MKTIIGPLLAVFLLATASASEEGAVALGEFWFKSAATGNEPAIEISGQRTAAGAWKDFRVRAFGRVTVVPPAKLAALGNTVVNGVMVSRAEGYAETGGRTVYVTLLMGFTSGVAERWILSVDESGGIELTKAK